MFIYIYLHFKAGIKTGSKNLVSRWLGMRWSQVSVVVYV